MLPNNTLLIIKHRQLYTFIQFALQEGWSITVSAKSNIKLNRIGFAGIYTAAYLLEKKQLKNN